MKSIRLSACIPIIGLFILIIGCNSNNNRVSTGRTLINFNSDWKFLLGDPEDAALVDFNDANWIKRSVPHDWAFEEGITKDGIQGQGGGYHGGGIGWYRKAFEINQDQLDKTVYIDFDGVYMNSEVWINGHYLGKRPYGYISFRYNISDFLTKGKNVIAVRADNSKEPSTRWYHPCGIYAPVKLVVVNRLHIIPNGIFVTTPVITPKSAQVKVEVKLQNKNESPQNAHIEVVIMNPDGQKITFVMDSTTLEGNATKEVNLNMEALKPQLWSPATPWLYTLVTRVSVKNDVVDEVQTHFGFRSVEWKSETGFWLNGENIKLKGVCEHWEGGPVGGAWTKPMLRWKLNLLKDMGMNAIRPAHNPYPPMFYDLCDEIGLLVMDEIFDGWHKKAAEDYGKQAFDAWWQRDMTEWITRDRNHPSVFVYSLGNETHSSIAPELVALCHQLDPTRLVTSGSGNTEDMDIAGVNGGSEYSEFLSRKKYDKPFVATEAPHTWQTRGYYRTQTWWRDGKPENVFPLPDLTNKEIFFYEWDDPNTWNSKKNHFNSSYDNATVRISARKNWEQMRDLPWHSGHFRWTGFDYYGEAGLAHGGWPFNLFMGGVCDVAGFKKDLYYFYQSQWTDKPMVHILPGWTHPQMPADTPIPVWVYSNTDEVELFLNGRSLGKDKPGKAWNEMQCDWLVPYQEGKLEAVAYRGGQEVARAMMQTAKGISRLNHTIQKLEAENGFPASYVITTDGEDEDNTMYPYAENKVYYHLDGDIRLVSLENGDPVDSTSRAKGSYRKMFMGKTRAFLESTNNGKNASVTVGSVLGDKKLLASNQITIVVSQIQLEGDGSNPDYSIRYTTNGDDPAVDGISYSEPFDVSDGTNVKALVFKNGEPLLSMDEKFGADEGLFWGNEHSEDKWIGRGISIQAEEAKTTAAKMNNDGKRFKGAGFMTFHNREGSLKWYQENDGLEGNYTLRFRYAHNDKNSNRPMTLVVNDRTIKVLEFPNTGAWNADWKYVSAKVRLNAGANYIEIKTNGKSAPNIDEVIIE